MKNLKISLNLIKIVFLTFLLSGEIANGQITSLPEPEPTTVVPSLVQLSLQEKFPGVDPIWYRRYRGDFDQQLRFQAKFMVGDKTVLAVFNKTGVLMATVVELDLKDIPKKAQKYMQKNYPYNSISQSAKITQIDNVVTYELGTYIDNYYVIVKFNENGKFIQLSKG